MIIVMKASSTEEQLNNVCSKVEELGFKTHVMRGVERNVIGCMGDERGEESLINLKTFKGVERVVPILSPYKLASRQVSPKPSVIKVCDGLEFGGSLIPVIAGPCSVEGEEQIIQAAQAVKNAGATALRGGAFKPRSSTYSFQGLGEQGLKFLKKAKLETGLPIVTEVLDQHTVELVCEYADMLQIGARNMQNYALLKAVGRTDKAVLLKRGLAATAEEFLSSAEYILAEGNAKVVLCERGIRTFEKATRNTLDINVVPVIKAKSHLPIVVDPSHATGVSDYVTPISRAAVAAGADGLIVEVHPEPKKALSDGAQSLKPEQFAELIKEVSKIAKVMDREIAVNNSSS